ncbi:MAG: sugar phosphate nucleotidyltransferase, partial [Pyrinomonadaceae bacterium]
PLTVYTPKPIVPVLNRPFILYQLDLLRRAGIKDITLSLSYQPDKLQHLLGDGSDFDVNLTYVTEPSPMGTAGAYKFAAQSGEPAVVLNGDILTDADISRVISFHKEKGASATIVLTPVGNPESYGLVETDKKQNVVGFLEKPKSDQVESGSNTINAGIYVLEPEILELVPKGENHSFEYDVFPEVIKRKMPFVGFDLGDKYWRDIGTCESYLAAHLDFLDGKIKGFELENAGASEIATAAVVDKRSILGEGCVVKPGANVVNSVIGTGVIIEEKAVVENSVIWPHTRISTSAEVRGAIIGRGGHIGRNALVREGTVLGDKASLPDYSRT